LAAVCSRSISLNMVHGLSCAYTCAYVVTAFTSAYFSYSALHWLPISQRVIFKVAVMMFDCSRSRHPRNLGDVYTPVHTVAARSRSRSADHGNIVPRARSTRFGCHSFRMCGPTTWNKLPQDSRSTDTREQFKRRLKDYLSVRMAGGASDGH